MDNENAMHRLNVLNYTLSTLADYVAKGGSDAKAQDAIQLTLDAIRTNVALLKPEPQCSDGVTGD